MTTTWFRLLFVNLIVLALGLAAYTQEEQKLATIQLGISKAELVERFGRPSGKMIAIPPIEIRTDDPTIIAGPKTAITAPAVEYEGPPQKAPNILIFTDYLARPEQEVMIGDSTIVSTGTTTMSVMMTGPGMSASPMALDGSTNSGSAVPHVFLPPWAYSIRAITLNTDQEQLIYKINDTYTIAVTVTKDASNQFMVTDIVACSFEPLVAKIPTQINYKSTFNKIKGTLPARTAKGIRLGSKFADVLNDYQWTNWCLPFVANQVSAIKGGASTSVPVSFFTVSDSAGSMSVSPDPPLWEDIAIVPGDRPVRFTDGKNDIINAGFSRNCLLIYPDEKVAFTLVDFKVVRIQIGAGVMTPPPTPKPPKIKASPILPGMDPANPGGAVQPGGNAGNPPADAWWNN